VIDKFAERGLRSLGVAKQVCNLVFIYILSLCYSNKPDLIVSFI
jgi:hypothetical protein